MRKSRIQYFTMLLGCLLAMVIVCSQVSAYKLSEPAKAKTEQTDSNTTDEVQVSISLPSFSMPSPLNVELSLDFHCLFEISFDSQQNPVSDSSTPIIQEKLLNTLFRVIIAPNAP